MGKFRNAGLRRHDLKDDWEVNATTGEIVGLPSLDDSAVTAGLRRLNEARDADDPDSDITPAKHWLEFFFVGLGENEQHMSFSVGKFAMGFLQTPSRMLNSSCY